MHDSGACNVAGIAALFSVSRPAVYRSLDRAAELPRLPAGTPAGRSGRAWLAAGPQRCSAVRPFA